MSKQKQKQNTKRKTNRIQQRKYPTMINIHVRLNSDLTCIWFLLKLFSYFVPLFLLTL